MAFRFIRDNKNRCAVSVLCRKLGVSRSGYYAWLHRKPSERDTTNEKLLDQIKTIHIKSRMTYGSPRVHAELTSLGEHCSVNRVARIMRDNGVVARMTARFKPRNRHYEHYRGTPNRLLKHPHVTSRNAIWVGDLTYIKVNKNWIYLAVVMDLYTRKIIGWSIMDKRTPELAIAALEMAASLQQYPKGQTIFHSDQGIEYAANRYRHFALNAGLNLSMSRKGCCWDNAFMESFFHSLKTEMVYFEKFTSIEKATAYMMDYISFYNGKRLHSGIGYVSPNTFESRAA